MPLAPYSIKHLKRIMEEENLSKNAKTVLLLFFAMKNKTNSCFPSYPTIMVMTGIGSKSTISKAISELEEKSLINVTRERINNSAVRKSNRYQLKYKF